MPPILPRKQVEWSLATLARLLQPVVRLALATGIKHAQFEEVLRQILLTEAMRLVRQRGGNAANVSQLSVITGLHRKELTKRVQQAEAQLPRTDDSLPSRVFTRWLQHISADPSAWRIPFSSTDDKVLSFEKIARLETKGNVHAKPLLEEMERLGVVRRVDRDVELNADGFVPTGDLQSLLSFLGDNGRDHLAAGVDNVVSGQPHFLERSIFTQGLSLAECERIQAQVRERWNKLHGEVYADMLEGERVSHSHPTHRMRVGVYVYYEPTSADPASPEAPSQTPPPAPPPAPSPQS